MRRLLTLACLSLLGSGVQAALPEYISFQLQARAKCDSCAPASRVFNLPANTEALTESAPDLNDSGVVVARVLAPSGQPGDTNPRHVFVGQNGAGFTPSEGPTGSGISPPTVAADGRVWFAASGGAAPGVYRYAAPNTSLVTALPAGASSYNHARGNVAGQVGYRAEFALGKAWVSLSGGTLATHAQERSLDAGSPYSALFPPAFDENRLIAGKLTVFPAGFHQIRTLDHRAPPVATTIALSTAEQPSSPYVTFDDGVSIAPNSGLIAFVAGLAGGARGVFLATGPGSAVQIARTGVAGLTVIEPYPPAINDDGLVAFIARDANGREGVYVGDDTQIRRVIGRNDLVPADLGSARIEQASAGEAALLGGLSINSAGDIAFLAALTPAANSQIEWGLGVYVARTGTQSVFADGFEN